MISVNVEFIDTSISKLSVSGHANHDQYGKDIVCAGVSAVVIGGVNALDIYSKDIKVNVTDNLIEITVIKDSKPIQIILQTILTQLETIEQSYQKNIKIKK